MDWTGQTLAGRYVLETELGRGGMGSVYLGRDEQFRSRRVVVKVPHPNLLNDEFRARFEQEIDQLVQLEHPRIIHVYDAGEHDGVPFLIVQYVEGGDLRARMPRGERLTADQILGWLPPVAEGLDFIHRRNRVHRDVKPGNILFDAEGNPFLADFGIATVMSKVEETIAANAQLTATGGWVGSPVYAPPESMARDLRPQYDQYSLAAVVYEALSGGFPHEGETAGKIMTAKMTHEAVPVTQRVSGVPPLAAEALMRALSKDPSDRFETCGQFVEFFRVGVGRGGAAAAASAPSDIATQIAPGAPGAAGGGAAPAEASPRKRGFPVVAAAAAGGVVLLLAIALAFLRGGGGEGEGAFEPEVLASAPETRGFEPAPSEPPPDVRPATPQQTPPVPVPQQAPPVPPPSPEPTPALGPDRQVQLEQALAGVIDVMSDPTPIVGPMTFVSPEGDQAFAATIDLCAVADPTLAGLTNPTLWLRGANGAWDYSCGLGSGLGPADAADRYAEAAQVLRNTLPGGWKAQEATDGSDVHANEMEARSPFAHVRVRLTQWAWGPSENELEFWIETDF